MVSSDLTSDEGFSQSPWAELKEWTQFNTGITTFGKVTAGHTGTSMKLYSEQIRCYLMFPKLSLTT